jgi:hypothetical protein
VSSDVWIGAVTTLAGAVLGGAISFLLSRQQMREARRQRQEEDARERRRRSADRRFEAYADFLTRTRSFRNAVEAYYLQSRHQPFMLGRATREFQNAARNELDVAGPAEPWDDTARPALEG